MGRRVGIVGSRSLEDNMGAMRSVDNLVKSLNPEVDIVVTGGAGGIDTFAENACKKYGVGCLVFRPIPPKVKSRGAYIKALFERNTRIVDWSTEVQAFWEDESKGTADTIRKAEKMNRFVKIWRFDG